MLRFRDKIKRAVDAFQKGVYTADSAVTPEEPDQSEPDTNRGDQQCSMCGGPMEVPPDRLHNPDAAPQCINCDRKPKGKW